MTTFSNFISENAKLVISVGFLVWVVISLLKGGIHLSGGRYYKRVEDNMLFWTYISIILSIGLFVFVTEIHFIISK